MDYIKRLFVFLRQRTGGFQSCNGLKSSVFAEIPAEILCEVADYLPPASAVSFSLTCRHLQILLKTRYIDDLQDSPSELLVLLRLIERDLHDHIVCDHCRQLHKIQDAKKYIRDPMRCRPVEEWRPCVCNDISSDVSIFILEQFSTTVFKMAMKHHHFFGNDHKNRQLLRLLSGTGHSKTWENLSESFEAECKIQNGSFFICRRMDLHGTCRKIRWVELYALICPHLRFQSETQSTSCCITTSYPMPNEEKWTMPLLCKRSTEKRKTSLNLGSELQQCQYCRTEFMVAFEHSSCRTSKLEMTVWKDLGQAPESAEWNAHLGKYWQADPQPVQINAGEIASVFQTGQP